MFICEVCGKEFAKSLSLAGHKRIHSDKVIFKIENTNLRNKIKALKKHNCQFCNKEFENGVKLGGHTVYCKLNPKYNDTIKKITLSSIGREVTNETREKVSKGMKKAHIEGRAWNIGKSRWNNEPSYPEKFFMKVIENEFNDKKYQREFNVGIYSIDFAWIDKKIAIEIDGQQHERFEEYKLRDERKDQFLIESGWKVLRLKWKDFYNDPKIYIRKAKEFIED